MRYELMLPQQIRTAIAGRWPVVLPLGVLEYHGEHLGVGGRVWGNRQAVQRTRRGSSP